MTFGAMAAWQAWLLLAAAAALAVRLFLLKLRPPRVAIPSLLLWRRVLDESREVTLWERIRRAVSLVLTVLLALALTLAITRPGRAAGGGTANTGRVLIVLDSSWSMQARTGSGETRWERAIGEARRIVAAASGSEIALATTAEGLVEGPTTDGSLVETSLDRLAPGGSDSSAWPQVAGAAAVHFLTDGAVPRPLDAAVILHSVFEPAANAAVTALDVRPSLDSSMAGDAYVEISNFAPSPQDVHVILTRGETTIFDRDLSMGAAETVRQVVPLPRGGDAALRARVSARDNALGADDEAFAWIDRARPLTVAVVGRQTDWLRRALASDPGVRARFIDPTSYLSTTEDVAIFDGWAPPAAPARPALFFGLPLNTPWLGTASGGSVEHKPRWEIPGSHPVVLGVDPFTLSIERARAYDTPQLVPVAYSARGTPLVYVGESRERRLVVVTFGADESNLAGAPGFPVLLGNALDWLTHPARQPDAGHQPRLVTFEPGVARVTGPGGVPVALAQVQQSSVGWLRHPGLYTVDGGGARSVLAINVGDPHLSNLSRQPSNPAGRARGVAGGGLARPWWVYCALAALALAVAEWWTWQRRITV